MIERYRPVYDLIGFKCLKEREPWAAYHLIKPPFLVLPLPKKQISQQKVGYIYIQQPCKTAFINGLLLSFQEPKSSIKITSAEEEDMDL
jgi:hypothetical protein